MFGERLIEQHAARHQRVAQRPEEIAVQVPGDDDEIESAVWESDVGEVGAERSDRQSLTLC
ncbi:MAG: hypothetical protein QM736_29345 [Vicinamibacterales bacterium]